MRRGNHNEPILTTDEVRQGRNVGLIVVLSVSLVLAALAGLVLYLGGPA